MWQSWNCPERCTTSEYSIDAKPFACCLKVFSFSLKLWNPVVTSQKPFNTWPQNSWIPCLKLNGKSDMWISAGKQACRSEKIFHICGTLHVQLSFDLKHCSHLVESYLTSPQCLFWNLQWSSFHKEGPSHARPFKVKHFWIAIFATTLCQPAFLSNSVQLPVQRHGFHYPTRHLHVWWHVLAWNLGSRLGLVFNNLRPGSFRTRFNLLTGIRFTQSQLNL